MFLKYGLSFLAVTTNWKYELFNLLILSLSSLEHFSYEIDMSLQSICFLDEY